MSGMLKIFAVVINLAVPAHPAVGSYSYVAQTFENTTACEAFKEQHGADMKTRLKVIVAELGFPNVDVELSCKPIDYDLDIDDEDDDEEGGGK